jgi:hypothetical protein
MFSKMSKWTLVFWTAVFLIGTVVFRDQGACVGVFIGPLLVFGIPTVLRFKRDYDLSERAQLERVEDDHHYGPYGVAAPKTTPGSGYIGLDFPSSTPPESM